LGGSIWLDENADSTVSSASTGTESIMTYPTILRKSHGNSLEISMGQDPANANPAQEGLIENWDKNDATTILRHSLGEAQDFPRDCGKGPFPLEWSASTGTLPGILTKDY
jgi:hypothetical protein